MSLRDRGLHELDLAIQEQYRTRSLESGLNTALAVLDLLGCNSEQSPEDIQLTKLQLPNAERYDHWFQPHPFFKSNRSCFELVDSDVLPLQAKFYWLQKKSKLAISGGVHFSPNWEDSEFTRTDGYKVGIDFFLSADADSILIVLSDRGNLRIVELNERLRSTQVEIFTAWSESTNASSPAILHSTLWNTFQLQAVNEKFYVGIANAFAELVQHFKSQVPEMAESDSKQFTNRLIGRLLFCWFLKKRDIIDLDQRYFNIEALESGEYYHARLEPLFFLTLNTPIALRADEMKKFIENSSQYLSAETQALISADLRTPYLNGGLFEPHANDYFGTFKLNFPNGYFIRLFEHFNSYNFTTDESSPEYEQVAIDPEMLGKVFESLLATQLDESGEQARKSAGAFYTPRNIVHFMCTEAIRSSFASAFVNEPKLIKIFDELLDQTDAQWAVSGTNSKRDVIKGESEKILAFLKSLKILDPACGSGAFPLGMLHVLTKLHQRLAPTEKIYGIKLHYLESSIFGADIEPMAIEISRLRAWLSLIVDELDLDELRALPNLDFHFIACNSLITLESEPNTTLDFMENPIEKLNEIRSVYFAETDSNKKRKLQERYRSLKREAEQADSDDVQKLLSFDPFDSSTPASFFDSKAMFGVEGKFDVVIGNPPYIRQEKISYKKLLNSYRVYDATADLYTYFFEMGLSNIKSNGVLSYITGLKFGRAMYGSKVRNLLAQNSEINHLVEFNHEQIFAAFVDTWVLQVINRKPSATHEISIMQGIQKSSHEVLQTSLVDKPWTFLKDESSEILNKISNGGRPLGELQYKINRGLKTGSNEAFQINEATRDEIVNSDKKSASVIKPSLRGRNVSRYGTEFKYDWLIVSKNGLNIERDYIGVAKYLAKKNDEMDGYLEKRGDKGKHWMNLRDCAYYESFEAERIICRELAKEPQFTLARAGDYMVNSIVMISGEDLHYILGILNSKVTRFFMQNTAVILESGSIKWEKFNLEKIRIPWGDSRKSEESERIRQLVSIRLSERNEQNALILENQIDELVCDLFSLTMEERSVILN
jgi:type I restriction-modification system DNA methylase subunit